MKLQSIIALAFVAVTPAVLAAQGTPNDSASATAKARVAAVRARDAQRDSARAQRTDRDEDSLQSDSGKAKGLTIADSAKARAALHHGAHHSRGLAVGIDNRPVTPATPAVPATRATVGANGTVTAAVPAKPATPASPATVGVGVTTGGSASTHRPSDPGQSGGRRP